MARHNREGKGADQRGHQYSIGYQPDWLRQVKVTRDLETGRQSTKTLFRNPGGKGEGEGKPGDRIRTRITAKDQSVDFEVVISDPNMAVRRIRVSYELPGTDGRREEEVEFTLEDNISRG